MPTLRNLPQGVDVSDALNAALVANTGGRVVIPGPCTIIAAGIRIPTFTTLEGDGPYSVTIDGTGIDRDTVTLAGDYASLVNIGVLGTLGSSSSNAVTIAADVTGAQLRHVLAQHGMSCLHQRGSDVTIEDVTLLACQGGFAPVIADGTGWWHRVKDDTPDGSYGNAPVPQYALYLGPPSGQGVMENYFTQCDFSGPTAGWGIATFGVYDQGAPVSVVSFHQCVLPNGGSIPNARAVEIVGGSRSGVFSDPRGVLTIGAGMAF